MRESLCYRLHYKTPLLRVTLYRRHDSPERAQSQRQTVIGRRFVGDGLVLRRNVLGAKVGGEFARTPSIITRGAVASHASELGTT